MSINENIQRLAGGMGSPDAFYEGFWDFWDRYTEERSGGLTQAFYDGVLMCMNAKFGRLPESVIDCFLDAPVDKLPAVVAHYVTVETLDQRFNCRAAYPPDELEVLWQKLEHFHPTRRDVDEG